MGTVIAKGNTREYRTNQLTQGGEVIASWREVRIVKTKTEVTIGVCAENEIPSPDTPNANPTATEADGIVYESNVQWNPITGRYVKTTTKRDGSLPSGGGWQRERAS